MQRLAMGLTFFAAQSSFLRQIFVLLFSARDCVFEKKSGPDRQRPAEAGESGAIDIQRSRGCPVLGVGSSWGTFPSLPERGIWSDFSKSTGGSGLVTNSIFFCFLFVKNQ